MLNNIKKAISQSLPSGFRTWIWWLTDGEYRRSYGEIRERINTLRTAQKLAGQILLSQHGATVLSGPFAGMNYFERLANTVPTNKILGTYEKELWPIVEEISKREYTSIIDIGAAEGYYVVGLSRRLPRSKVIAFEANTAIHPCIQDLARKNGVSDRIEIRGLCDSSKLKEVLTKNDRCLVICDIEGAEQEVLNPVSVPQLSHADILVEVHDHLVPGITSILQKRFSTSHHVADILGKNRRLEEFPLPGLMDENLQLAAMNESRAPAWHWLWLEAKGRS